jgi:hypothetical protein
MADFLYKGLVWHHEEHEDTKKEEKEEVMLERENNYG